ncbi:Ca(2+)-dependent cysteine protease, partial [Serendipita sp. 411]
MRRTKALLIGINYHQPNPSFNSWGYLSGPHRDVRRMLEFLSLTPWTYDEIRTLTDEADPTKVYRNNIIENLEWLVEGSSPGDSLLLHYSGHGYQRPTRSPTEDDGFDETIVPADCPYPPSRPGSDEDCPVG